MPEPADSADSAAATAPSLTALITTHIPDPDRRARLLAALTADRPAIQRWHQISRELRTPDGPHPPLYAATFADHDPTLGPPPAWTPTDREIATTHIGRLGLDFPTLHHRSVADPQWFWPTVLEALNIPLPPDALTGQGEHARWRSDLHLNAAAACFTDRDPDRIALIGRRQGESRLQKMTLGDLQQRAQHVARALRHRDLQPGDPWAIAMPMTVESIWIYLGIVLAGGVVISIADTLTPPEIATRLRLAGAKGIFTQDVILRGPSRFALYARIRAADAPPAVVLPAGQHLADQLREGDVTWAAFVDAVDHCVGRDAQDTFTPHLPAAHAPSNILFSSTTPEPTPIPWTHLTPLKAAADAWAHHDLTRDHIIAWPTHLGSMMGPWLIYASLLNDAAIALFEGDPTSPDFCRFVADAKVTLLGVDPTLVRTWRTTDAPHGLDWTSIRCFSSTGEPSHPDDMLWLMARAGYKPIIEYRGTPSLGGAYIAGSRLQSQSPSTFSTPAIGCRFVLLDDAGHPAEEGKVALAAPLIATSETLHHPAPDHLTHLGAGYYRHQGRADKP